MTGKKKLITGAVVVLVVIAVVVAVIGQKQDLAVEMAEIKEREIFQVVLANGHFQAASKQEIMARDPVVIKEILVKAGDKVKEGQMLAITDTSGLEAEKKAIEAEITAISIQLATLEAALPLEQAQAESHALAAKENLLQTEREAEAMTELYNVGAVSEMDWLRAQNALAASRAQEQDTKVQVSQVEAKAALNQQYLDQIEALSSRIRVIGEKLDYNRMKAPATGQVLEVYAETGALVGAGTPLFLLSTSELLVKAEVLAQDAPRLTVGQKVLISGEVMNKQILTGKVNRIHPQAVEKMSELGVIQYRVSIDIVLEKEAANMRPGYPVEVEIITNETVALAVPREAVFSLDGKDYVFAVKDGRASLTSVEIGLEGEDYMEILTGLDVVDIVIINPPKELADGIKVRRE